MPAPLLETKTYLPQPPASLVPRPRLGALLDAGSASRLTLVSAPAGFGKTTLLTSWLAGRATLGSEAESVAWLSLDRDDDQTTRFWTYVIAALQTVAPGLGDHETTLLASAQPPPIELVLTTLINDLAATSRDLVLVLDDFHLIRSPEVMAAMSFLLDHLPPRLRVVIAGRADPALPLARMRGRGELVEIRAADLRFTAGESAAYLNDAMRLDLTALDLTALDGRTEGWIAALQLAALSMRGRDDPSAFIAGFTGDDRYIVDYLLEEVLQRQPRPARDFLLHTSVLARLDGSLCDAVTGRGGGRVMLETLDRDNVFVVPLDDRRRWYRYHHLFADVLRARLAAESPELLPGLHQRACDWYADAGHPAEAIGHALAGSHVARAADLVEAAMPDLRRNRQEAALRGWLERLPPELVAARPALSNGYAGVLLTTGRFEEVEQHLRNAEAGSDRSPATERLQGEIAVHRAGLSLTTGDLPATVAHARRALDLLADDHHLGRGAATGLLGLASWWSGDLDTARESYARSLQSMHRAGHLSDVLGLSLALTDILLAQGRLREAMRTFEQAVRLTPSGAAAVLRGTADMYVGMSLLHLERNDLQAARSVLARSGELGEHSGLPQNDYRRRVARARLHLADGQPAEAVHLLDEAERRYVGDFSPDVRPVPAVRARAWILQGRVAEAAEWTSDRGLSVEDELGYLREFEHVTLARVLRAAWGQDGSGRHLDEAAQLLERLAGAARSGHRTGSLVEILVLQALTDHLRADLPGALVALEEALVLAEPEGFVRVFVDEGATMRELLEAALGRGTRPDQVRRLLAEFAGPHRDGVPRPRLVDPLSRRELEVLRLLGTDLTGPQIADHLVVSVNTVRTHTKSIYAKLGVNSRRAAVRRGAELEPDHPPDHHIG